MYKWLQLYMHDMKIERIIFFMIFLTETTDKLKFQSSCKAHMDNAIGISHRLEKLRHGLYGID